MQRKLLLLSLAVFFLFSLASFKVSNKALNKEFTFPEHSAEVIAEVKENTDKAYKEYINNLYHSLNLSSSGMDFKTFSLAVTGFFNLKEQELVRKDLLTIVDFGKSSIEKRMWIIDLKKKKLLLNTLVAHGKNSGVDKAMKFSNTPNSRKSSLGFYVTSETYQGKHGLSLRLEGKDKGFNTNARSRSIVLHGADYVSEDFIRCNGRLGRSYGCPAVPRDLNEEIINQIKDGSVLFIYHPDQIYNSELIKINDAVKERLISQVN